MQHEAHGTFDISITGEVVTLRFFHSWNLEGAKAFFSQYKDLIKQSNLKQYGVLSDLRRFEGATPDAITFFEEIVDWAHANGQVARALIMDSRIKEFTIRQIDKGRERWPTATFSNEPDAMDWLKSRGLILSSGTS